MHLWERIRHVLPLLQIKDEVVENLIRRGKKFLCFYAANEDNNGKVWHTRDSERGRERLADEIVTDFHFKI